MGNTPWKWEKEQWGEAMALNGELWLTDYVSHVTIYYALNSTRIFLYNHFIQQIIIKWTTMQ